MSRTLGLIGSGLIGSNLARMAVAAEIDVVVSNSRGPETLAELVAELGPRARAALPVDAAEAGDIVVVTIPLSAYQALPADALAGKTVIDTNNYYPQRDGRYSVLDEQRLTSSELVQQHLSKSRVVKAFNNISFFCLPRLSRPAGAGDRSALPIAGDDMDAKSAVSQLLDDLGYDSVDFGTLSESWRSEPGTLVYVNPYLASDFPDGTDPEELQRYLASPPIQSASSDRIRHLIDSTERVPAGGHWIGDTADLNAS